MTPQDPRKDGDWKDKVMERYHELKEQGKSFFPYSVFKDLVAVVIVLGVVSFLALHYGAELEDLADPASTDYNPRPEWYFLWVFQLLKYFPGNLEALATVVLPGVGGVLLLLLPLLDRGSARHPLDRPWVTLIGVLALAGVLGLTIQGALSPMTNPVSEADPAVVAGKRLFVDMRCNSCHSINGRGGVAGPPLDDVGARRSKEWMAEHFRDPKKVTPGSVMPKFGLLESEVQTLVGYLSQLGAVHYSKKAPALFKENCASCHRIGDYGDEEGPNLSKIGLFKEAGWIERYIRDPEALATDATMPAYKDELSAADIKDLAYYLEAQRGGKPVLGSVAKEVAPAKATKAKK